jgi:hypothetical protein
MRFTAILASLISHPVDESYRDGNQNNSHLEVPQEYCIVHG